MNYFNKSAIILDGLNSQIDNIDNISKFVLNKLKNGNKLLVAGNGGSHADAQHFVGELTCTFKSRTRDPFPAISLMDNVAALSAWSNDFDFNDFLERQVKALGSEGDILFLLSTSGGDLKREQSLNLINAAHYAKNNNIFVISLVGGNGGELYKISDYSIKVNSDITSHIQESHIAIIHYICEILET